MKTKISLLFGWIVLLGIFPAEANAQQAAIKALIKKCETMDSIDINIVRTRDMNTREVVYTITEIHIKSNPALVREFQDAFRIAYDNEFSKNKDDLPDQEIITKKGDKIVNLLYMYGNVKYSFLVENNGQNAHVTVMEDNKK
jgi:hypothetical protein